MKVNLRPLTSVFDPKTRRGRVLRGITLWCGVLGSAYFLGTMVLAPMMVDAAGLNRWNKGGSDSELVRRVRKAPGRNAEEPAIQISYAVPKSGETTYKLDDDRPHRRRHRRHRRSEEENTSRVERDRPSPEPEADAAERRDSEHVEEHPSEEPKGGGEQGDGGGEGDGTY